MKEHIKRQHNVSLLIYHFVCPAKHRREIFSEEVEKTLIDVCEWIESRYDIRFEEIGADWDHIHFLIQSVPTISPKQIIQIVKSLTARELSKRHPEIKKKLWWWELRTRWYYVNTVWVYGWYDMIKKYVMNQWTDYKTLHVNKDKWIWLFEWMIFS